METNEKGRKAEEKREKREDKIKKLPLLRPRDVWTDTIEFKGEEGRIPPFKVASTKIYTVPKGHRLLLKNVKCSATSERGLPSNAQHKIQIVSTPHGFLYEKYFLRDTDKLFDPPQVITQNQNLYVYIHNMSSEFIESTVNITGILERAPVIKLISIAKFIILFFTKLISIAKLIFT